MVICCRCHKHRAVFLLNREEGLCAACFEMGHTEAELLTILREGYVPA